MRKVASTVVRFLGHPVVSAASTAYWIFTSIPAVLAFVTAVLGDVLGEPILFILAFGLALIAIVLAVIGYVRSRPIQPTASNVSVGGADPTLVAVEAEIALAHEEAIEMTKLLRSEWPHITPEGAVVQVALPDWKTKTTDFIGTVLGSAQRAAFKGSSAGDNVLERLESEGKFLSDLALRLAPSSVRTNESEVLEARRERRSHEAAKFLTYDYSRAPGAPSRATATGTPKSTDSREFGRRDDRGDLAKRCHMFAASVERWVQAFEDDQGPTTVKMAEEWLEADPDIEPGEAHRKSLSRYETIRETDYRLKYEAEAQKLFTEAWELHEVAKELEQLAVRPLAIQFGEVPKLFNEIAESLYAEARLNLSISNRASDGPDTI